LRDGLWDPGFDVHMGTFAEKCNAEVGITREEQDAFAVRSYRRAVAAQKSGASAREIAAVEVPPARKGGEIVMVERDEEPGNLREDKVPTLRAAFDKGGSVTAANASKLSDGAAALVLVSEEYAAANGVRPIAVIRGCADAEQAPDKFTTAPALAIPRALARAGVKMEDVDLFEVNEAFACVAIANARRLGIDEEKLNVLGGAVAMGHPLGCSGARIVVTLLNALKETGGRIGVAAICNGGGGASAIVVELVE